MSDDKPKPVDDLKEGLGLLFRAAKGAVEGASAKLHAEKIEDAAKDAVKEVSRAVETIGTEIERVVRSATGTQPPAPPHSPTPPTAATKEPPPEPPPPPVQYDDGYAPEPPGPPKGPRVG